MEEVKRLRLEKGWNQNELAFHAGLAPSVISLVETGKREPNATTLRKLAKALGVEIPDLFKRSDSPKGQAPLSHEEEEQRCLHYLRAWRMHVDQVAKRWRANLERHNRTSSEIWLDAGGLPADSRMPLAYGWASEVSAMADDLTESILETLQEAITRFTSRERREALEVLGALRRLGDIEDEIAHRTHQEILDLIKARHRTRIDEPKIGELEQAREKAARRNRLLDNIQAALAA